MRPVRWGTIWGLGKEMGGARKGVSWKEWERERERNVTPPEGRSFYCLVSRELVWQEECGVCSLEKWLCGWITCSYSCLVACLPVSSPARLAGSSSYQVSCSPFSSFVPLCLLHCLVCDCFDGICVDASTGDKVSPGFSFPFPSVHESGVWHLLSSLFLL